MIVAQMNKFLMPPFKKIIKKKSQTLTLCNYYQDCIVYIWPDTFQSGHMLTDRGILFYAGFLYVYAEDQSNPRR